MPKFDDLRHSLHKRSDLPEIKKYPLLNPYKFKRTLLIDTHNLAWKCFHAKNWKMFTTSKGVPSGPAFGSFTKLFAMIKKHCIEPKIPSTLVFVYDEYKDKQIALFPEYKANRDKKDANPVPEVIEILNCFPHLLISIPSKDEEADSIIASYMHQNRGYEHLVLSSDRDMWQLWKLGRFFDTASKEFNLKDYHNTFGDIPPKMIPLYKAIFGDSSDNIPSIINLESEIGQTTRNEIIETMKIINKPDKLFNYLDNLTIEKHAIKIRSNKNHIRTMYQVCKLRKKSKIHISIHDGDFNKLRDLMIGKWECKSKINDINFLKNL